MTSSLPQIFNRQKIISRRHKSHADNLLYNAISDEILERLDDFTRKYNNILIYGPSPYFIQKLVKRKYGIVTCADPSIARLEAIKELIPAERRLLLDEEKQLLHGGEYDLIISFMSMHSLNDPIGALIQYKNLLAQNGLFIACQFGAQTLQELRQIFYEAEMALYGGVGSHIHPTTEVKTLGSLLQRAGFELPVADSLTYQMEFDTVKELVDFIRYIGENNALMKPSPLSRKLWEKIKNNRLVESFEILFITGLIGNKL